MAKKASRSGSRRSAVPDRFRAPNRQAIQGDAPEPPDGERALVRIPADRADAATLTPEDRDLLVEDGLPRYFAMHGFLGSIRVPEDERQMLKRLAAARRALAGQPEWADLVILAHMGAPVAKPTELLCLREGDGSLWHVRPEWPAKTFVNSNLRAYGASLGALVRFSRILAASFERTHTLDEKEAASLAKTCVAALRKIDPRCLDASAFWPDVIEREPEYWRPKPKGN